MSNGREWTTGEDALLRELVKTNHTAKEIGSRLGRSEEAVYAYAHSRGISLTAGVPGKRGWKAWTSEDVDRLATLALDGYFAEDIAQLMDRSIQAIYNKARSLGIRLQYPCAGVIKRDCLPEDVVRAVRVMADGGVSCATITRLLNRQFRISPEYVRNIARRERRTLEPKIRR